MRGRLGVGRSVGRSVGVVQNGGDGHDRVVESGGTGHHAGRRRGQG